MSDKQMFGELAVFVATCDHLGKRLPVAKRHPMISDGRFGELYSGDGEGARELAADLLAAPAAYDKLADEMKTPERTT